MNKICALFQRESSVYIFAIITSILLSLWIDVRETVINPDAVCYLMSAREVGAGGISSAMHLCGQAKWPFYSVLIYGFVQITHLSYSTAAYVIDGVFSAISVLTFILIIKELGGSRRVLWLAALVILLWHEFNSVREYIVRDHGFWAFYLASILFLLHYFRTPHWKTALCWSASILIATLFRIEGAIFLLTMPFLVFFTRYSWVKRSKYFLMLNIPTLLMGFALVGWVMLHPQQTLGKMGRVAEVTTQLQHGFLMMADRYQVTKVALSQHVLTLESVDEAGLILFLLLIVWYLVSVITNLSWVYSLLVFYAWVKRAHPWSFAAALVVGGYLVVNLAITFGFLAERLFLSKRYLIALSLVLLLWVPFVLDYLMSKWSNLRYRFCLLLAAFFIVISSLGGIFDFGYSKSYIHEAGDWMAENIPAKATLYVNDYQLMYYSQHFGNSLFEKHLTYTNLQTIANDQWKQYDYLALRLSKKNEPKTAALLAEIKLVPAHVFSNRRGDKVVIYKVNH